MGNNYGNLNEFLPKQGTYRHLYIYRYADNINDSSYKKAIEYHKKKFLTTEINYRINHKNDDLLKIAIVKDDIYGINFLMKGLNIDMDSLISNYVRYVRSVSAYKTLFEYCLDKNIKEGNEEDKKEKGKEKEKEIIDNTKLKDVLANDFHELCIVKILDLSVLMKIIDKYKIVMTEQTLKDTINNFDCSNSLFDYLRPSYLKFFYDTHCRNVKFKKDVYMKLISDRYISPQLYLNIVEDIGHLSDIEQVQIQLAYNNIRLGYIKHGLNHLY